MARSLALPTKRFSLTDIGEGWDACYITYRPLTAGNILDLASLDTAQANLQGTEEVVRLAKERVVGGKVLTDDGPAAMEPDDLDGLPVETLRDFFTVLTGGALDPKALSEVASAGSEPSSSASNTN